MARLDQVYRDLLDYFGPQDWWPGDTPFEVMVGAVLTQNTNWKNVEKALEALRTGDMLRPAALAELAPEELAELIRPAGYYRLKARRLKHLVNYLMDRYAGSTDAMFARPTALLREELLAINGIGPETADSILLYAGNQAVFVVDTYTARMLMRHQWIDPSADYDQIQAHLVGALPRDVPLYNEFHALIVQLGKRFCRKRPECGGCPLESLLPPDGPC